MSNAATWFVGRLQTERDKARIIEGLRSVRGDVDVDDLDRRISGLDARQFILHSAHLAAPVELTSRWAMSYLAGPLTAEQLRALTAGDRARTTELGATRLATSDTAFDADAAAAGRTPRATPASDGPTTRVPADATVVMPPVAEGTPVRWLDPQRHGVIRSAWRRTVPYARRRW